MKKIILTVISAALLFANAPQDTKTQTPEAEAHVPTEVKASQRTSKLEAKLAKREADRLERSKLREERLKKLDTDLATKAEQRSTIVY
ncbi:MAG: hypothetical protein H8E76_00560 [Helicobacteraceae bacterium]|nr:hypothetical protein [Candidatus Sulfurimonas ponti]